MNEQAHILIAGRDPDLLASRGLVLQTAGHRVSMTMQPIQRFADVDTVDLLIVCHTLSQAERQSDLDALSIAAPEAKGLCLRPYPGEVHTGRETLDSFAGPRELLRVVNRLFSAGFH